MNSNPDPQAPGGSPRDLDVVRAALCKELKVEGPEQEALLEYLVTGRTPGDPGSSDSRTAAVRLGVEGVALADRGHHEEAIQRYDQALQLDPSNALLWGNKARSAEALGRFDEALQLFDRARELSPSLDVASHKGRVLMRMKRLEEALVEFDRSLAANVSQAASWHNRSVALWMLERREEALASLESALRIDPHHVPAWHNKGAILEELGRSDEARQANDRFLEEFQPHDSAGWSKKASEALRLELPEVAIECLRRAAELSPSDPVAWMNLTGTLFKLARHDEALLACERAAATGHPKAGAIRELIQRCQKEGADQVAAEVAAARGGAPSSAGAAPTRRPGGLWSRLRGWFGARDS